MSEGYCAHNYDIPFWRGRNAHPEIKVVTDKGTNLTLKWVKNEYRVFNEFGDDLKLGATVPQGLVEYVKERL